MTKLLTSSSDQAAQISRQTSLLPSPIGRTARRAYRWIPVMAGLLLAACASAPPTPPEEQVRQLAAQRWQALIALDFDKAYTFTAPSYRQINTLEAYKKNHQGVMVKWLAAKVLRATCEEKKCALRIELESKPVLLSRSEQTMTGGLDESWVLEDGRWWVLEAL